ncbi:MAG: PaaI family thioesterase [Deltaproteobacteria bacterium]|nr:PaaI family thioesterase [Deltaproteobacteria bacterium]
MADGKETWTSLPNLDRLCFACGTENHFGLKMTFTTDGERLRSLITLPNHTRGWHNLVHGGILATVLDETMSWAAIHFGKGFILTKNININFRKPVFIGTPLAVYGEILARKDKELKLKSEVRDQNNSVCCSGAGDFILFSSDEFARLELIPPEFLQEMAEMFRT